MASKNFKILIQNPKSYAIVDNIVLRHKTMSLQAKGLYALLCGFSDEMIVSFDYILSISSNGRDALRSAFKELEDFKCIKRTKINGENGQFTMLTEMLVVTAETIPVNNTKNKKPLTEKPPLVKPSVENQPMAGNPPTVNQSIKNKTNLEYKRENLLNNSLNLSFFDFVDFLRKHNKINGQSIEFVLSDDESVYINSALRVADWKDDKELDRKDAEIALKTLYKRKDELVPKLEQLFRKKAI